MKSKSTLFPGLSMFLCFCLQIGTGRLSYRFGGGAPLIAISEAVSFLLPALLLWRFGGVSGKKLKKRLQFRRLPRGGMGFTIKLGISIALVSLFLNLLIYQICGVTGADLSTTALDAPQTGLSLAGKLLVIVLLSAVVEEVFLRGTLFCTQERGACTGACLLLSGLAFAMLHGSLMNFAGPFIAGVAYAYLTYSFGSIWPAVIAHTVNNLYYIFVVWITETYAAFGIWNYFAAINGLLLLLFLYLTLRAAEPLLVKGYLPHFQKGGLLYDAFLLVRNPGTIAFAAAFVAKAVFHWI